MARPKKATTSKNTTKQLVKSPANKKRLAQSIEQVSSVENSGGSCDYYRVFIPTPTTESEEPYIAECNDVIENLDMTYAEANMFKEIWRTAAGRTLGKVKDSHNILRGADKIEFFANRNKIRKNLVGK